MRPLSFRGISKLILREAESVDIQPVGQTVAIWRAREHGTPVAPKLSRQLSGQAANRSHDPVPHCDHRDDPRDGDGARANLPVRGPEILLLRSPRPTAALKCDLQQLRFD